MVVSLKNLVVVTLRVDLLKRRVKRLKVECIKRKVKKILHVSSDEVYGEKITGTCYENRLVNPTNPYSASKAAAEVLINSYKYTYKKEIIIVRANNIYGIRQYPEKLISTSIVNLIKNKPIPIHGNGRNIRFYLSAVDFANALIFLVKKREKGIYNIGSNFFEKNINIAKHICKICWVFGHNSRFVNSF